MSKKTKSLAIVAIVAVVVLVCIVARVAMVKSKSLKDTGTSPIATESKTNESQASTETVAGDGFNTNELDAGVQKEEKSNAGLGMGAYSEAPASTEGDTEPETLAETDADGKNVTVPVETAPTVARDLSASEYGAVVEKEQAQNNAVITDTSSPDSIGGDVDSAISAIQADESREAESRFNDPEFHALWESYHAND